jgi:hypothetical protein
MISLDRPHFSTHIMAMVVLERRTCASAAELAPTWLRSSSMVFLKFVKSGLLNGGVMDRLV